MGVVGMASVAASAAGSTVDAVTTATFGTVLTDAQGFALYTLPTDQNGMSIVHRGVRRGVAGVDGPGRHDADGGHRV